MNHAKSPDISDFQLNPDGTIETDINRTETEGFSVQVVAVIPAFNESSTIGSVIDTTRKYVDHVLVVDDCSTDNTVKISREHGASVIEHLMNTGVGGAVRTGYRYAIRNDYDFVVQIDADGQHDPAYIPKLLEKATDRNADMVIGSRYLNESIDEYAFFRRAGIRAFTTLVNLFGGIEITDVTSGYRVYRVSTLREVIHRSDRHWAVEQTLEAARRNHRIEEVSVKMPTRETGESQFGIFTVALYPFRMTDVILRVLIFR